MAKKPSAAEILRSLNVTARPSERAAVGVAPLPPENKEDTPKSVENEEVVKNSGVERSIISDKKPVMRQVTIKLTGEQHRALKQYALDKNTNIIEICVDALVKAGVITK